MQLCMGGFFMKVTKLILHLAALILSVAAVVCLLNAHYEKITDCLASLLAKAQAKKEVLCRRCPCGEFSDEELDEYEEWGL